MNRTEHLLTILAEECAEVAQRASKALRFGLQEIQPGQGLTNAQRIGHELNDLWAVVELLEDATILALASDNAAIERKKEKVRHFMGYAQECGVLSAPAASPATCTCPSGDGSLRWPCRQHPPSQPVAVPDGLIDLLRKIRPEFGAVGSRDVDVRAQQERIDAAIAMLSAAHMPPSQVPEHYEQQPNGSVLPVDPADMGLVVSPVPPSQEAKDAERLDWLIRNEAQVFEINRRYSIREVTESNSITSEFMTARDAIDAAMATTQEAPQ